MTDELKPLFSERMKMAAAIDDWYIKNPAAEDCALNTITAMSKLGYLRLSTQQVNAIQEAKQRMAGLHEYLNSKELTNINRLINDIEHGKQAERELRAFLDVVPVGEWDANRKKYAALVLENTGDE